MLRDPAGRGKRNPEFRVHGVLQRNAAQDIAGSLALREVDSQGLDGSISGLRTIHSPSRLELPKASFPTQPGGTTRKKPGFGHRNASLDGPVRESVSSAVAEPIDPGVYSQRN